MGVADEIRARRGDPDDPFDQEAARRDYRGQRRREESSDRANVTAGHKAGVDEERKRAEKKKRGPANKRPAKKKAARARRTAKRTYRQLRSPLRSQVAGFTQTFGLTLAVIALYQLLSSAGQVSGALDGFRRGFEWLARPDAVVLPDHQ